AGVGSSRFDDRWESRWHVHSAQMKRGSAMRRPIFVLVFVLECGLAPTTAAQQGGSAIRGRVTDEQKGVLPGASIVITHQESGTIRETNTGPDGSYLVQGLVPGPYRIAAQLAGFRQLIQEDVVLRVGATIQVDLALQVGGVEEKVTVTGESPQ